MNPTTAAQALESHAPVLRGTRIVIEDHGTYGTTTDKYRDKVRGISYDEGFGWSAMTNVNVRYFKTVAGAARHLARCGYDAYGCRA